MQNRPPRLPGETNRDWLNRTDEHFPEDLARSEPYVHLSGEWFQRQGFWVVKPNPWMREDGRESDLHDLWTGKIAICEGQEVKSRVGWDFHSLPDFTAMGGRFQIGTLATVILDTHHRLLDVLQNLESIPVTYQQWSEDRSGMIEIDVEKTLFQNFDGRPIWARCWQHSPKAQCDKVHILIPIFTWHGRPVMTGRELKTIYRLSAKEIDQGLRPVRGVRYVNESMLQARVEEHKAKIRKAKRIMDEIPWMLAEKQGDKFVEQYPLDKDPGDPKTRREERERKKNPPPLEQEVARLF